MTAPRLTMLDAASIPTPPLAPADPGHGPPPRDRAYYTKVIHNAARVDPADPRYPASRVVAAQALDGLATLAAGAGAQDRRDLAPGQVGTALVNFGHGASLGLAGDPTYLQLARAAHPVTAGVADALGTVALSGVASPLVAGAGPVWGGAALGAALGAGRGAIEPLPGLSRAETALLYGGLGAAGGAAGGVVTKFVRGAAGTVRTIAGNVAKLLPKTATQQELASATETAVRGVLGKQLQLPADVVDRAVASWKATGVLDVRALAPDAPLAVRPGVTLTAADVATAKGARLP